METIKEVSDKNGNDKAKLQKRLYNIRYIRNLVPQDHLVRKLDYCIDFTFIEDLVKDLYSDLGRPSIPPVVLFK